MGEHEFRAGACALAVALGGCATGTMTERSIQGQLVRGPSLDSRAYAHATMASVLEASGERVEALQYYQSALTYAPANADLLARVGNLLCPIGLEQAQEALAEAERLAPEYPATQIHYALCLEQHGRLAEATGRAERAVGLMPSSAEANRLWARLLRLSGKPLAAARASMGFELMYPDKAELGDTGAFFKSTLGDLLSDWSTGSRSDTSSTDGHNATREQRAHHVLELGQSERAKELLQLAARSSPHDEDRQQLAIETALKLQDWEWALHLLRDNRVSGLRFAKNAKAHKRLLDLWVGQEAGTAFLRAYRRSGPAAPLDTRELRSEAPAETK